MVRLDVVSLDLFYGVSQSFFLLRVAKSLQSQGMDLWRNGKLCANRHNIYHEDRDLKNKPSGARV